MAVKADALLANRDLRHEWAHIIVEAMLIHPEVGGRVSKSNNARLKCSFGHLLFLSFCFHSTHVHFLSLICGAKNYRAAYRATGLDPFMSAELVMALSTSQAPGTPKTTPVFINYRATWMTAHTACLLSTPLLTTTILTIVITFGI